ncbi:hypothetical protein [Arthrobacter sp. NPDC090010]|uniref:hypothetical protein n=1 Tax=Arthrobacter sp. NPDC090010 TaxID=3363942 RepID=UPI0038276E9E
MNNQDDPTPGGDSFRLWRLATGAYALFVAVLVLAGLGTSFFTIRDTRGDSHVDTPVSVLVVIFRRGIAPSAEAGDDPTTSALFMTGFIGLLVVALLVVIVLVFAACRALTTPMRRISWLLMTLGVIGALVLLGFTLRAAGAHQSDSPGWGGFILLLGMIGISPLLTRAAAPLVSRTR